MSERAPLAGLPAKIDEERLAHILVSRGMVTEAEAKKARGGGPEAYLKRLVEEGFLGRTQAQRLLRELPAMTDQQIPGYQVLDVLGTGAMGTVFKARQLSMNRLVAIKVLKGKHTANAQFLERFRREAHLAARLSHNNIVQAIDVASIGNLNYLVMEYVEGQSIYQTMESGRKFGEKEAVEIILQITQAIEHAHRRGLIHRDIKPANILLTSDGMAKLADLGMAREMGDAALTRAEKGITLGTPFYISPEQIRAKEDIDGRTDIYSLGATLYHMVTGRPPFPGPGIEAVLDAHLKQELTAPQEVNPEVRPEVGDVIAMMMTKDRRQRYQTPEGLIVDLECLLSGEQPRLARPRIEAATLLELAGGELVADEDEGYALEAKSERSSPRKSRKRKQKQDSLWLAVLGIALALSLLANLALILLRK
jgi:serine/threonine-protein kinase